MKLKQKKTHHFLHLSPATPNIKLYQALTLEAPPAAIRLQHSIINGKNTYLALNIKRDELNFCYNTVFLLLFLYAQALYHNKKREHRLTLTFFMLNFRRTIFTSSPMPKHQERQHLHRKGSTEECRPCSSRRRQPSRSYEF